MTQDRVSFRKEPGVRLHPSADRPDWMVLDPAVSRDSQGWTMLFFESRGIGGGIPVARSRDGLTWSRAGMALERGAPGAEIAAMTPEPVAFDETTRLYYTGHSTDGRRRILSAAARPGGRFEPEPGVRIDVSRAWPDGAWSPCLIRLGDGRWRMYFSGQSGERFGIYSAVSEDGLSFRIEQGERLSPVGPLDRMRVRHARVWQDGASGHRMLYAGSSYRHYHARILSAASDDGVTWHREDGIRVDVGGPWETVGVFCPYLVAVPGGWRLYYGSYWGLHFRAEGWLRLWLDARRHTKDR